MFPQKPAWQLVVLVSSQVDETTEASGFVVMQVPHGVPDNKIVAEREDFRPSDVFRMEMLILDVRLGSNSSSSSERQH